jgi:hypothetical protein
MPVMPAAPVVAPKASDDMTGSVGFGVGVGSPTGTTSLLTVDNTVAIKYWMSDAMALVPRLTFTMAKSNPGTPGAASTLTAWQFNPEVLASFVLLKGASTRLAAGAGLGITLSKNTTPSTDTTFGINIPIELGVEHFFTRWFSMGIAAHDNFLAYTKTGSAYNFGLAVNTLSYMGSLFIYTD